MASHRIAALAGWLAAATPSVALAAADERPVCPIAGHSDGVERGVNRTNLSWEKNWQGIIDQIAAHGVSSIRLSLHQPVERSAEIAAYAERRGLHVLMNVLLSLGEYYDPTIQPRPGNKTIRAVRRLSDLDLMRYRASLDRFLAALDRQGGRLFALEVGNEINWADFNGDLPVGPTGVIIDERALAALAPDAGVLEGFRKYKDALDISRALLRSSAAGKDTLIMSGGLYMPGSWSVRSGGSALTIPAVHTLFDRFGITQAVDANAVHVYPPSPAGGETAFAVSLTALRAASAICGDRDGGKPCYITEWGFSARDANALDGDRARLALFRAFEGALSCLDRTRDLRASYLYTWDESQAFSVWRRGHLTGGGAIFADPPIP